MKNSILFFLFIAGFQACSKTEKFNIPIPADQIGEEIIILKNFETGKITSTELVKIRHLENQFLEIEIKNKKATGWGKITAREKLFCDAKRVEIFEKKSIVRFEPSCDFWKSFFNPDETDFEIQISIFTTEFE